MASLKRRLTSKVNDGNANNVSNDASLASSDTVIYALDGIVSKSIAVRRESFEELASLLTSTELCKSILFQKNKEFSEVNSIITSRLAFVLNEAPSQEATLSCLALSKLYSVDAQFLTLAEPAMLINMVPDKDCLLSLSRLACSARRFESTKKHNNKKATSTVTSTDQLSASVLESTQLLNGLNGIPSYFSKTGINSRDASLLALGFIARIHAQILKSIRKTRPKANEAFDGLLTSMRAAAMWKEMIGRILIPEACKQLEDIGIRLDMTSNQKTMPTPEQSWRLSYLTEILERYSSVIEIVPYFPLISSTGTSNASSHSPITRTKHSVLTCLLFVADACLKRLLCGDTLCDSLQTVLRASLHTTANLTHNSKAGCDSMAGPGLNVTFEMLSICARDRLSSVEKQPTTSLSSPRLARTRDPRTSAVIFDTVLCTLGILANCAEDHAVNRSVLGHGCEQLVEFFVSFLPESVTAHLREGNFTTDLEFGWTPEELITCSYTVLLMGCMMRNNPHNQSVINAQLPGKSAVILMQVLETFLEFQNDAQVLSDDSANKIIGLMKEMRIMIMNDKSNGNTVINELVNYETRIPAMPTKPTSIVKFDENGGVLDDAMDQIRPVNSLIKRKSGKKRKSSTSIEHGRKRSSKEAVLGPVHNLDDIM